MRTIPAQAWVVGVVLLCAPIARADDIEMAKRLFEIGETLYGRSDYEGAIRQFREAYRLSRRPDLIYNIARSHEALGQHQQAIDSYLLYLKVTPKDLYGVHARVTNIRRVLDRERAAARAEQVRVAEERRREQEKLREERERRAALERELRARAVKRAGSPWPGWIVVGGGATLAIVGGILLGVGEARQNEVEDLASQGLEYSSFKSKEESGRNLSRAGFGVLIGGAAVAVVGGVLSFLHYRRSGRSEQRAWLVPFAAPEGGGVALVGKGW